jgi:hypothetical protein
MMPLAHTLSIPVDRLPADSNLRQAALENYFGDLLATTRLDQSGWLIDLIWPDFEAYFVDPQLPRQLGWWKPGLHLGQMRQAVMWSGNGQLSLDDAWTLFAWSRWLRERGGVFPHGEVTVIHVDDHRDMMTPRIAWDGTAWNDLLTGQEFTIFDPESVRAAIMSGAIGVGSFFAPFLHQLQNVVVRHLSQSAALSEDGREWLLVRGTTEDTIIRPGHPRPSLTMRLVGADVSSQEDVAGRYRFTPTYERCLTDLPPYPVLLHIDMDFFNNRYDRDSDWRQRPDKLDPHEPAVLAKIDEFFEALHAFRVASLVENVSVALSPGFFPAEYWPASVERVERHLEALGLGLGRGGEGLVHDARPQ